MYIADSLKIYTLVDETGEENDGFEFKPSKTLPKLIFLSLPFPKKFYYVKYQKVMLYIYL